MDMRTGKMYESFEDAKKAGVPESDIAKLQAPLNRLKERLAAGLPVVKFTKGSFKSFQMTADGKIVPMGK